MLEKVAKRTNCTTDQAGQMPIYEFLNWYCYDLDDENRRIAEAKKHAAEMKAKYKLNK